MRINAQIKWNSTNSVGDMESYLSPHSVDKKRALMNIFGGVTTEQVTNTEISMTYGTSEKATYFVFVKGAGNTSQINGRCLSNRFDHLKGDFDMLINTMKESNIKFNIYDIHFRINDEKLSKKTIKDYVLKRGVVTDLFGFISLPHLITALFSNTDLSPSLLMLKSGLGLLLWAITLVIGYRSEPEYAIK